MTTWLDAVFNAVGIGASTAPPTKALGPTGKRARDHSKDKLPDVEPARKKKPKAENNKVFDRTTVQTALVWPSTSTYTKAVLEHCEKFFMADSEIYEPIAKVIEEVFQADGALAAGEKLSPLETKAIIEAIQRFIRERKLTVGDHVEDESDSIAETSPDGKTIHLHRDLSLGYAMKEADQTQKRRALALGTLKFVHEMMHSLTPFILEMSFQRKRANGVETKKSDLTPPRIGTKSTKRGKAKKELGDMGFALEELLSGGRRFFPRFKLSKIGSIQVAERNDKGEWVKKSLKKQSEEELIDIVLAPKIDFGRLGTLCSAIVEKKKKAKKRAKKSKAQKKKRAEISHEDEGDEGDEECPVLDEGDEGDEGDEFPIIEKYNPNRKK